MSIKKKIARNISNFLGWKTKRKIIVIESDDWGTIRVSSKEAYNSLLKQGFPVDKCPYNRNDALESNKDLELLFDVLLSVKDKNNNPAIITANNITANPDFQKIRKENFENYYYEPFIETLKKYPEHNRVYDLYNEGIKQKVFQPQFHGREHVNILRWIKSLQKKEEAAHSAFEREMFSVSFKSNRSYTDEYMDSFGSVENLKDQHTIISEGLNLFENIWGFKSKSFIAPCYTWDSSLEQTLRNNGIKYIQGIPVQLKPKKQNEEKRKRKYHYLGQKNSLGQRYLIRNVFFEPSIIPDFNFIQESLERIDTAFKWNKPAVIGSHRLNYIGYINAQNRERNLKLLADLLHRIKKKWPDVEFMSSDQLGDLMNSSNK